MVLKKKKKMPEYITDDIATSFDDSNEENFDEQNPNEENSNKEN